MKPFKIAFIIAVGVNILTVYQFQGYKSISNNHIQQLRGQVQNFQKRAAQAREQHSKAKKEYASRIELLNWQVSFQRSQLKKQNKARVLVTGYHPWSGGINSYGRKDRTATMTKPRPGWTCAISSELVRQGWLGKRIYIEGVGVFKAEDRMNSKVPGKRIDLCMGTKEQAMEFGKKENLLAISLNG